jgi:hypothetical protein
MESNTAVNTITSDVADHKNNVIIMNPIPDIQPVAHETSNASIIDILTVVDTIMDTVDTLEETMEDDQESDPDADPNTDPDVEPSADADSSITYPRKRSGLVRLILGILSIFSPRKRSTHKKNKHTKPPKQPKSRAHHPKP